MLVITPLFATSTGDKRRKKHAIYRNMQHLKDKDKSKIASRISGVKCVAVKFGELLFFTVTVTVTELHSSTKKICSQRSHAV